MTTEELDKEDKPTVQKVIDKLKKGTHGQSKVEKDLQDNVDKTLDKLENKCLEQP